MAIRVMVVDDALFMRNILKDIFVRHGYELSLIHISEPTRLRRKSRMTYSA